jgi:presenilin-like A22 family membrane protease
MRKDPAMDRTAKVLLAGAGIGMAGGLASLLLLMLFIGENSAADALPYLIGGWTVIGWFIAARYLR